MDMKIKLWAFLLLCFSLQAAPKDDGIRFIVEEGAHMTFSDSPQLFSSCEFVVQRNGVVSVKQQTIKPHITYAKHQSQPEDHQKQIHREVVSEVEDESIVDSQYKEQLEAQLTELGHDIELVKAALNELLSGSYDLPNTALSSQDAGRINRRCAVLEKRFDSFSEWAQTTLQDLPLLKVAQGKEVRPALATLLQKGQKYNNSVGVHLQKSVMLNQEQPVFIEHNVTIHGQSNTLTFLGGRSPQLIIRAGAQLILHNVVLKNITAHSIVLEKGASLRCGNGVVWELHDDLHFDHGSFEVIGSQSVVQWHGMGAHRQVSLGKNAHVDLKHNTLALSNISLLGSDRVCSTALNREINGERVMYTGALGLCGNARLICSNKLTTGLVIAGTGNELISPAQRLTISEPILFDDDGYNELFWYQPNNATCCIKNDAVVVTSEYGSAHLRYKMDQMTIRNELEGSFVVGVNGMVHASSFMLEKYPCTVIGSSQPFSAKTIVKSVYDNAISFYLPDDYIERKYTAYHLAKREPLALNVVTDSVATGTTKMQAMHGGVALKDATITEWGTHEESKIPLALVLNGSTTLQQGDRPITIRESDTVAVSGVENKMILTGNCEWRGRLRCQANSCLTIFCEQGARLLLQSVHEQPWLLEQGARICLQGPGAVEVKEQFDIGLGTGASLNWDDGISFHVMPQAEFAIVGNGAFTMRNFSSGCMQPGGKFFIGKSDSDACCITLDSCSELVVGSAQQSDEPAQVSCAYGSCELHVLRSAKITVHNRSVFECNMRNGHAASGRVEQLHFEQKGALFLHDHAKLLCAENRGDSRVLWIQNNGGVSGSGLVGLNTMKYEDRLMFGRLQKDEKNVRQRTVQMSMRSIVASLINVTDSLHSTLYFVNSSGTSMIHTKGHVIVPLNKGDTIVRDTLSGMVWGMRTDGDKQTQFRLNAKGRPQ